MASLQRTTRGYRKSTKSTFRYLDREEKMRRCERGRLNRLCIYYNKIKKVDLATYRANTGEENRMRMRDLGGKARGRRRTLLEYYLLVSQVTNWMARRWGSWRSDSESSSRDKIFVHGRQGSRSLGWVPRCRRVSHMQFFINPGFGVCKSVSFLPPEANRKARVIKLLRRTCRQAAERGGH